MPAIEAKRHGDDCRLSSSSVQMRPADPFENADMRVASMLTPCLAFAAMLTCAPALADESAPWAEIKVGNMADKDRQQYDVVLMAINGSMDFRDSNRYELAPGRYSLRLASTRRGRSGEMTARPFAIEMKPCVRYDLVADHAPAESEGGWKIVVRAESPIRSCAKKFGLLPVDGGQAVAGGG
jgi:hypothetical protein